MSHFSSYTYCCSTVALKVRTIFVSYISGDIKLIFKKVKKKKNGLKKI